LSGTIGYYDTGGGQAWDAWNGSIVKDFQDLTTVTTTEDYNQGDAKFYAAEQAGQVPWSLVLNATVSDGLVAEKKGYLVPLDKNVVPLKNLLPGTFDDYGVYAGTYGMVLAWNTTKWPLSGPHPSSMADLYNMSQFPGKRCMYNYPEYGWTLESALIADGVSAANLYPLDVNRAIAKLDTIKKNIVWWSSGGQSVQDFENGSCDLGMIWSGRAFVAATQDHAPLAMTWNQGGYVSCLLSIPKGAPNPKAAQAFLRMVVLDKQANIKNASLIAYPTALGPTNVGLSDFPTSTQPFVPFGPNVKVAAPENDDFYSTAMGTLLPQFNKWLAS